MTTNATKPWVTQTARQAWDNPGQRFTSGPYVYLRYNGDDNVRVYDRGGRGEEDELFDKLTEFELPVSALTEGEMQNLIFEEAVAFRVLSKLLSGRHGLAELWPLVSEAVTDDFKRWPPTNDFIKRVAAKVDAALKASGKITRLV